MSQGSCLFTQSALHASASPLRSLYLQIFRGLQYKNQYSLSSLFMPGCFIPYIMHHLCKQTYISILSSPLDQIPPGYTVSIAVDSGGRGALACRSDCSGSSGGAHIRCPSLIPPGPIGASPSIHHSKSRWRLLGSSSDFSSTCQMHIFFKC